MKIDKIFLDLTFNSKDEVFHFLSEQMKESGIVEQTQDYYDALLKREAESTTGLVDGFAIPHGKSTNIKDAAIIYIRNTKGIDWNSLDGSLVTDIFALAIPENGAANHLDTLIAISTKLMDQEVCRQLRKAENEEQVKSIFA